MGRDEDPETETTTMATITLTDLARPEGRSDLWERLASDSRLPDGARAAAASVVSYWSEFPEKWIAPPRPAPFRSEGVIYGSASPICWAEIDGYMFEYASLVGRWNGVTVEIPD